MRVNFINCAKPIAQQRSFFPISRLNDYCLGKIRKVIEYRNSVTGAGRWRSGEYGHHKLRTGYRTAMIAMLDNLVLSLEEEEGGLRIANAIDARLENMQRINKVINRDSRDQVSAAISGLREKELSLKGEEYEAFVRGIYPKVFPFEVIAENYLMMIDAEIDAILKLFGLTKYSKI